jgi:hypothetical protein
MSATPTDIAAVLADMDEYLDTDDCPRPATVRRWKKTFESALSANAEPVASRFPFGGYDPKFVSGSNPENPEPFPEHVAFLDKKGDEVVCHDIPKLSRFLADGHYRLYVHAQPAVVPDELTAVYMLGKIDGRRERHPLDEPAAPPAPVVEWTDQQCIDFACVAFRHAPKNLPKGVELNDIRMAAFRVMSITTPSPTPKKDDDNG